MVSCQGVAHRVGPVGGYAEGEEGGVVVEAVAEAVEQAGQRRDDLLRSGVGEVCREVAQCLVPEQFALLADPGLGESVRVEQEGVARRQRGPGGGESGGGQDADEETSGGGEVVGPAVPAQDEGRGWPPEASSTVTVSPSGSRMPKIAVQ